MMKGTVLIARVLGRLRLIAKWTQILPIPGCISFCNITSHFSYQEVDCIFPFLEPGLGHMACFHQCDTGKCDTRKDLKSACTMGLALSCCPWELCNLHYVKKPGLASWRIRETSVDSQHTLTAFPPPYMEVHPAPINTQTCE